ncbi:hypothetical protein V2E24_02845 [Mycoplasmopsis ciconiae]|uniref:ABC transmembrane type-1 domain-containing protein n=1 Tax=Mycoplasmopsis ciconiae TaxID=561067 RepID=A0ABU7MLU9_9BACT|nr:hypothetical protein [Mycoplasmopsis ciconiae]
MQKKQFNFVKNQKNEISFNAAPKKFYKTFLERLFIKKTNILILVVFSFFVVFSICYLFISPYSANKSIINSIYAYNLPSIFEPKVSVNISDINKYNLLNSLNEYGFSFDSVFFKDGFISVTYNPYSLINAFEKVQNINTSNFYTFLGTNNFGIDNLTLYNKTLVNNTLVTFFICVISWLFGTFFGVIHASFSKRNFSLSYHLISLFALIPSLIVVIIFFNLYSYTLYKFICIMSFLLIIPFYLNSFIFSKKLKNTELYYSYISLGFSDFNLIYKFYLPRVLLQNLILIPENNAIALMILASLSFFDIEGIFKTLNIGNLFKDIIDNFKNYYYSFFVIFTFSGFLVLLKLISFILFNALTIERV